jgi:carbonic anhydrase
VAFFIFRHSVSRDDERQIIDVSVTEEYLANNQSYKSNAGHGALPLPPSKGVAVVACMDARLDVYRILGLHEGEAHVIRNAGGVVTEDALRSLVISQQLLGTKEIILIHHTDCGMVTFKDDELRAKLAAEVGAKPLYAFQAFPDVEEDVREGIARIKTHPFLVHHDVRGFVFDVDTGKLHEVHTVKAHA